MSGKVSVIIPVYNVEKYLKRCLDTVLSQTYSNFEILLIDDGSTDNSFEICKQYQLKDNRINLFHTENQGLSAARNYCLDRATGEYVAFIDSDDWIDPKYFEKLISPFNDEQIDISVCNFIKTSVESNYFQKTIKTQVFSQNKALKKLTGDLSVQLTIACAKIYRRQLFISVRFPIGKIHEDEFIAYQLISFARKISYTTEPLYFYWQNINGIMSNRKSLHARLCFIEALNNKADFYYSNGYIKEAENMYMMLIDRYFQLFNRVSEYRRGQNLEDIIQNCKVIKPRLNLKTKPFWFVILYNIFIHSPYLSTIWYKLLKINKRLKSYS